MKVLRTPDTRFQDLCDFPFGPHYFNIGDTEGGTLRVHYLDEGSSESAPVLLMHGEPTWSYMYRHMIPILTAAGHRVVAPDLVGFGRSDKPSQRSDYTYQRHVDWMSDVLDQLDLQGISLVCQDWGGLIGLRLLARMPHRFTRLVVANTALPTGDHTLGQDFMSWRHYSQQVPSTPDDPAAEANRRAWDVLRRLDLPVLTLFGAQDKIMKGVDRMFQRVMPGAEGQPHQVINGAGHFLQEDVGTEMSHLIDQFVGSTSG